MKVSLKLPFLGEVAGTWQPDESERKAAWEMYVELVTRVGIVDLGEGEGVLSEALASLYSLFGITRQILRQYGPGVARPNGKGKISFGLLAVAVLNGALRPLLSKWHPRLSDHLGQKPETIPALEWERQWSEQKELRKALWEVRATLSAYAEQLANAADVPSLIAPGSD